MPLMPSRHKRDIHLKCRQTLSRHKGVCFFLKCRQCRPAPQAGAYLKCRQCSPSTRVLVSTAPRVFFLKYRQRCPATRVGCLPQMPPTPSAIRVLISTAANATPPQRYMFSSNAANVVRPQCVNLNCRQRHPATRIYVFFLEYHQRRPPQLPQTP